MHTAVPLWLLVVVSLIAVGAVYAAASMAYSRRRKRAAPIAFSTTAEILGVRWRWRYREGNIRDIAPFCPKCDVQVRPAEETRHGFLHLISYRCQCGRWRSQSFQCSHAQLINQIHRTVQSRAQDAVEALPHSEPAGSSKMETDNAN